MAQEYQAPTLEVLGDLKDVTTAASGGFLADLVHGVLETVDDVFSGGS